MKFMFGISNFRIIKENFLLIARKGAQESCLTRGTRLSVCPWSTVKTAVGATGLPKSKSKMYKIQTEMNKNSKAITAKSSHLLWSDCNSFSSVPYLEIDRLGRSFLKTLTMLFSIIIKMIHNSQLRQCLLILLKHSF